MNLNAFGKNPDLIAVISDKKDGSMRLIGDAGNNKLPLENRKRFLEKYNIELSNVVSAGLVLSNRIAVVNEKDKGKVIKNTDGLITKERNIYLSVTAADCLPVFFFDDMKKIIGLIHAGRQGLEKNILGLASKTFINYFHSNPDDIKVFIGPAICRFHYGVKSETAQKFISIRGVVLNREGKLFLDIKRLARIQLMENGIKKKNIKTSGRCTFKLKDRYFSWHRDKPKEMETMLAVFGRR